MNELARPELNSPGDKYLATSPGLSWGGRVLFLSVIVIAFGLCTSLVLMHVGLGLGILGLLMCRTRIHHYPGFWWAVAFAAWQLLSMSVGSWQNGTPMTKRHFGGAYTWLALYVAIEAFRIPGARLWAVVVASTAAGASLILSAAQFYFGHGGGGTFRVSDTGVRWTSSGFFSKHLTQGFQMSQLALLAWTQSMSASSAAVRGVHWVGRIAPLLCILLTGGRSGLVGILSAWFAWFGCVSRRRLAIATALVLVMGGLAIGWLALVRPHAVTDAAALKDGRILHWQVAGVLIREHPILGIGGSEEWVAENTRVLTMLYPDGSQDLWLKAPDAHNSFLGFASEHGIPVVILYLGLLGSLLRYLWHQREAQPWAWRLGCGSIACALVAGQFEHYAGHSVTSYGLFIPLGFAIAMTLPDRVPGPSPG
jgi:O-antigen ligase